MEIDGTWIVRYAMKGEEPFINEAGDPDEAGTLTLTAGKLSGRAALDLSTLVFIPLTATF